MGVGARVFKGGAGAAGLPQTTSSELLLR